MAGVFRRTWHPAYYPRRHHVVGVAAPTPKGVVKARRPLPHVLRRGRPPPALRRILAQTRAPTPVQQPVQRTQPPRWVIRGQQPWPGYFKKREAPEHKQPPVSPPVSRPLPTRIPDWVVRGRDPWPGYFPSPEVPTVEPPVVPGVTTPIPRRVPEWVTRGRGPWRGYFRETTPLVEGFVPPRIPNPTHVPPAPRANLVPFRRPYMHYYGSLSQAVQRTQWSPAVGVPPSPPVVATPPTFLNPKNLLDEFEHRDEPDRLFDLNFHSP